MFSFQSLGWHWDGCQWGPFSILHISSFSIQWQVIAVHFPNVLQNRRCLLEKYPFYGMSSLNLLSLQFLLANFSSTTEGFPDTSILN